MAKRRDPQLRNIERRCHKRRDGSVLVVFRVRWVDEDGERQKETFDTLEAAIAFRDELEARTARLLEGPPVAPTPPSRTPKSSGGTRTSGPDWRGGRRTTTPAPGAGTSSIALRGCSSSTSRPPRSNA
jgi:hypothetical protein